MPLQKNYLFDGTLDQTLKKMARIINKITIKFIAGIVLMVTVTGGCVARLGPSDTHKSRYVVLGFGVVWVNDSVPEVATVSGVKSLGITVSDRPGMKFSAGYTNSYAVTVPQGQSNVVIEFSQNAGGDAKIQVLQPEKSKMEESSCK